MNKEIKLQILNKIKEYQKIIITRHVRPDGDCVGATIGLGEIIKSSFPDKFVYIFNNDYQDYLSFLGEEKEDEINQEEIIIDESFYTDSLVIVLDTSILKRASNNFVKKGKEVIKIDHHIETDPYGDINWVEEDRSSVCEMIVDFFITFDNELKITKKACNALYTGLVTDTGRFKFASCSSNTLMLASKLLQYEIDTENIYAHLYLKNFNVFKLQSEIYKKMKITENGVAYFYISKKMQKKHKLSASEASNMVSTMDSILGSLIWIAFIENDDSTIRVRLRSRYVTINTIAEKFNGGGHANASGATVNNLKELKKLVDMCDKHLKQYKESNDGWL